jgi:hypothetical protein
MKGRMVMYFDTYEEAKKKYESLENVAWASIQFDEEEQKWAVEWQWEWA